MEPIEAIAFDVNETLLDLSALDEAFVEAFGGSAARTEWFAVTLRSAFTRALAGSYAPFHEVARGALAAVARRRDVDLADEAIDDLVGGMRELPPHREVPEALARIAALGVPTAALTNSTLEFAQAQLGHAGLDQHLDMVLSVESVERFKPAAEVYHHGADQLGVAPARMLMIAAHDWDVVGAVEAGCQGAYVARPGAAFSPPERWPNLWAPDLTGIATALEEHMA